jgi:hypothetical protein
MITAEANLVLELSKEPAAIAEQATTNLEPAATHEPVAA